MLERDREVISDQFLKGFAQAKAKLLSCKFVETAGRIEVTAGRRLRVTFDRRYPILREAALDHVSPRIPGLNNDRLECDDL